MAGRFDLVDGSGNRLGHVVGAQIRAAGKGGGADKVGGGGGGGNNGAKENNFTLVFRPQLSYNLVQFPRNRT